MEIHVSDDLTKLIPNFTVGIIQYKGIQTGTSPQMLKGRLQLFQESLFFELEEKKLTDYEGINEWRKIFRDTGKDPNRYRHSAEALYRRVKKQQYIQPVNSAIDLNNFFSLQYGLPIGVYDSNKLKGDITIRIGREGEQYEGLNGRSNSLHNLIVSTDEAGPFGSPFVDSERSMVTEATEAALHIVYLRPSMSIDEKKKLTESLMGMFLQIHGGDGQFSIIGAEG